MNLIKAALAGFGLGTPDGMKIDSDLIDYSKPVFHRVEVEPAVRLCKG